MEMISPDLEQARKNFWYEKLVVDWVYKIIIFSREKSLRERAHIFWHWEILNFKSNQIVPAYWVDFPRKKKNMYTQWSFDEAEEEEEAAAKREFYESSWV